ncbi:MAG: velvet factor-domain-containing protein [Olpidium bornovanus]|uniref:Velvet factor-domain-containing protein n=1 Tax=Olpidium bornovanus TaxID=278681 RepID=A0A8H8A119_9FUNG|nr:MAG: velvet factor-domain-containing protein [Olpidium bornovanus]
MAVSDDHGYELVIVQQPLHARLCGFGDKDRRPIDPPPILKVINKLDEHLPEEEKFGLGHVVVHASLWSADGMTDCNSVSNPTKNTRILMGSLVGSPERMRGEDGKLADFVCFPDLSVRTEGTYTLKFSLMKIDSGSFFQRGGSVVASVLSQPLTVYQAKQFPGMTESTALSKLLRKQGMNIPIRNSLRPKKHQAAGGASVVQNPAAASAVAAAPLPPQAAATAATAGNAPPLDGEEPRAAAA